MPRKCTTWAAGLYPRARGLGPRVARCYRGPVTTARARLERSALAMALMGGALLGIGGCKDASVSPPPPDPRPADAPSSAPAPDLPAPPPAQSVPALEGEPFSALLRLDFEGWDEAPRFADDGEAVHLLRRDALDACPRLVGLDLEGRELEIPAAAQRIHGHAQRGAALIVAAPREPADGCPTKGWRKLEAGTGLWRIDGESREAFAAAEGWTGDPEIGEGFVLFASTRGGDLELWRTDAVGENPRRLTERRGADLGPRISADGTRIVWTASRPAGVEQLADWRAFEASGELRPLPTEIHVMSIDGSDATQLTRHGAQSFAPELDAAGRLWFTSNLHDPARRNFDLFRREGETLTRITFGEGFDGQSSVAPDGKSLLFVSDRAGEGRSVYLATLPE